MGVNYIINGETKVLGDIFGENVGISEMYQGVLENDKYGISNNTNRFNRLKSRIDLGTINV